MKIARVIITTHCLRDCPYCCNKYRSIIDNAITLHNVDQLDSLGFDRILITGGEPMLVPNRVIAIAQHFNKLGKEVFLYTAMYRGELHTIVKLVKGIHFTLHYPLRDMHSVEPWAYDDLDGFYRFQQMISGWMGSYRLYINPEIQSTISIIPSLWSRVEVKPWIQEADCHLPPNEELFILKEQMIC